MGESLFLIAVNLLVCWLVSRLGKKRSIGSGWSFVLCLCMSPVIGLIITLCSKKKDEVEFTDVD